MLDSGGEALQRGEGGHWEEGGHRGRVGVLQRRGGLEGEEGHCGSINRTATRPQSVILEPEGQ